MKGRRHRIYKIRDISRRPGIPLCKIFCQSIRSICRVRDIYRDKWYDYIHHKASPSRNELSGSQLYQLGNIVNKFQQHNYTIQLNGYMHAEIEENICVYVSSNTALRQYVCMWHS